MDDFNSETDSDYTSYWRDWVSLFTISTCAGVAKAGLDGSRYGKADGAALAIRISLLSDQIDAVIS